jgi:YD repeat-containing protein
LGKRKLVSAVALLLAAPLAFAQTTQTYSYDALGRLIKVTPGSGTPVCYSFDAADNRTSVSAAAGCTPGGGGGGGGQNAPPVANEDYVVFLATAWYWEGPLGVVFNDTDPDLPNDNLTVTSVTGSPYASVMPGGGDAYFAGPPGSYTLNYTIKDNQNATSSASIILEIIYCEFVC